MRRERFSTSLSPKRQPRMVDLFAFFVIRNPSKHRKEQNKSLQRQNALATAIPFQSLNCIQALTELDTSTEQFTQECALVCTQLLHNFKQSITNALRKTKCKIDENEKESTQFERMHAIELVASLNLSCQYGLLFRDVREFKKRHYALRNRRQSL